MTGAIATEGLSKRYGARLALDGLRLTARSLWDTIGALAAVPGWVLGLSPFHHVALVPAEPFDATAAAVMLGLAAVAAVLAVLLFERRDLIGA